MAPDSTYDLHYIGTTESGPVGERPKWEGTIFSRHGGTFADWWQLKERTSRGRQPSESFYAVDEAMLQLDDLVWDKADGTSVACTMNDIWEVGVFVKRKTVEADKLRATCLATMGGQMRVSCEKHHGCP